VFSLSTQCIDDEIAIVQGNKDGSNFSVAIVDDVLTTGVTVNTLSKRLKKRYPNLHIQVWVAAFTPPPKSSLYQKA
ncbi:MAG: ComF family protein, partial [Pseudomonadota bacterium]